ncbi:phage antirepressor KilAC domain-containing protein [uncultured Mitsuokella sp.]|uniref:phage antirepressor KilAC domain-containing protein n=1 Tax=uncultured Mitsuokella sp. TaxID=453120 RepID=UPI00267068C6|nr:phage antirepressor KilAC domain-containing protein [uncultured Mitsuokella sp.]
MGDLTKVPHVLDSREVAEMVGMRHADLMRNISHYVDVISTNAKLRSLDFFIERDYIDKKGESRKRYDITKKGCEMVANKLTGEKGILFTAEYVERFNQMEEADRQPKELTGRELMAKALLEAQAVLAEKDKRIEEMRPKEIFADAVSASKTSVLVRDLAKVIKQNGVDIGQNRLFDWLRENGYLIKGGSDRNMPTQRAMNMKLFEIKVGTHTNGDGVNVTTRTTKVTGKGQVYFVNKFLSGSKPLLN